ncbi:MAG: hypothetical protein KIT40_07320 [Nitrospira sp.]|nr:hypothetical protein [Nitrospira sp.]
MRPITEGSDIPERVPPAVLRAWATKLRQLQAAHDRVVARAQAAQRRAALLIRQRAQYHAELGQVNAQITATQEAVTRKKAEVAALSAQVDEHRAARDAATARLLGTDRLSGTVATSHPLLLFPVRVETRFAARRIGPGTDLLLRVYPDDIHLDSHEPALTEEEELRGKEFWAHVAAAPAGADRQEHIRQGWQRLTEQFGTTRAAWLAHVLDPAQPGTVTRRDDSWTRAPHTQVLPDRWVAIGYRSDAARVTAWGRPIPETVAVGPDPRSTSQLGNNGMPPVDEGIRWITDFDQAESIGMGLRIPVAEENAQAGFDRIVVLGLKASWDAPTTAGRLVELFDAHHYTGSLALVEQLAPTNNTADAPAGFRSTSRNAADSMSVELGASLIRPGSDGELLAQALGLPASVFAHVRGADGSEQRRSSLMQAALLALCDSPLMRQLLGATGTDVLRDHFTKYVRARGPLPVLRVDSQPYGLLPVAALDRWISTTDQDPDRALATWWRAQRLTRRRHVPQAIQTTVESNPVVLLAQEANAFRYTVREFPEVSTQTTACAATAPHPGLPDAAADSRALVPARTGLGRIDDPARTGSAATARGGDGSAHLSNRRMGHFAGDTTASGDAAGGTHRHQARRLRLGGTGPARGPAATGPGTTGRCHRAGLALGTEQGLRPRSLTGTCGGGGRAEKRLLVARGESCNRRRALCGRPVVRAGPSRQMVARRGAPRSVLEHAARLSIRTPSPRARLGPLHSAIPRPHELHL